MAADLLVVWFFSKHSTRIADGVKDRHRHVELLRDGCKMKEYFHLTLTEALNS